MRMAKQEESILVYINKGFGGRVHDNEIAFQLFQGPLLGSWDYVKMGEVGRQGQMPWVRSCKAQVVH